MSVGLLGEAYIRGRYSSFLIHLGGVIYKS